MTDPDVPVAAHHLPQVGGDIYDELVQRLGYQPRSQPAGSSPYDVSLARGASYAGDDDPLLGVSEAPFVEHSPPPAEQSPFEASPFEASPFEPSPFEPSPFEPSAETDDEWSPFGEGLTEADFLAGAPADDPADTEADVEVDIHGQVDDQAGTGSLTQQAGGDHDGAASSEESAADRSRERFYASLPPMPPLARRAERR